MIHTPVCGGKTLNPCRILLLRHAETSAPDRFHGAESDVGLGDRGRRQVEAVAAALAAESPHAVISSAMRRALDTAAPIARACGLAVRVEPRLHERKMGPLSGLSRDEGLAFYAEAKRRWRAGELDYTHPGGESFAAIRDRAVPVFRSLALEHLGQTVVVIAHGVVIRVLLTTLLADVTPADFDCFAIDNTGVNDLRFRDGRWEAVALNATEHLGGTEERFAW
jgi:broad specificity phosphatase PhoE